MNQEKIWDYFQNDLESSFDDAIYRYKFLAKKANSARVLNIGVGAGGLERELSKRDNIEIYSLDPSQKSIEKLQKELNLQQRAICGFSQKMPFEDSFFDTVIMSEVLEHLNDEVLEQTLIEAKRVLKPNGIFIGTVPADEDLKTNIAVCPNCGEVFHKWGHMRSFSKEKITQTLADKFPSVFVARKQFVGFSTLNWKGKIVLALKRSLLFFGINGANENFFFVATK